MGLSTTELQAFFDRAFPPRNGQSMMRVEEAGDGRARVRMVFSERLLRPGGTIAGPAQMTLVDTTMWLAVVATCGPVLDAVTSNLNITFLRRPGRADLIGECTLLKVGRRLAYGEVRLYSDGDARPVAHGTCTYALPPDRDRPA